MRIFHKAQRIDKFDERYYEISEDKGTKIYYPGVTHILNIGFAKGVYWDQWLKDVGNNADIIAGRAAESGSVVHWGIEQLLRGEQIKYDTFVQGDFRFRENRFTLEEWKGLLRFEEFYERIEPATIACESIVFNHELRYAGGYALAAAAERETGFDFLDHELEYAGGYALAATAEK